MEKTKYFYRTSVFSRQGQQVALANIDNPEEKTVLEPWFATVFSLADGKHSIAELLQFLTASYHGSPPNNLEKTIQSVLERLEEGGLVKKSEKPVQLPYYLEEPIEMLDLEKAKQKIAEDGYTQH